MPIPKRRSGERRDDFIGRCIANLKGEYPEDQAAAICYEQLSEGNSSDMYSQINKLNSQKIMTSTELKELVKKHFSLVEAPVEEVTEEITEEVFGEIKDINKAFTLKFPGDTLEVGDKVTVVTTEGQEMDAPNGTHELENGTKIVTEDSVVKEITAASETEMQEEEKDEEEMKEKEEKEEMAEVDQEVEGVEEQMMYPVSEIVEAIAEKVEEKMKEMKDKMAEMEKKMEKMSAAPAAKKTLPTPKTDSSEKFSTVAPKNADKIEMMSEMLTKKLSKK